MHKVHNSFRKCTTGSDSAPQVQIVHNKFRKVHDWFRKVHDRFRKVHNKFRKC